MVQTGERYLIKAKDLYATNSNWSKNFRMAKMYIRKGDAQNRVDIYNKYKGTDAKVFPVKFKFEIEENE
jgi:hypothetical protein